MAPERLPWGSAGWTLRRVVPLHHRLDGPEDAPFLLLVPSLGTTLDLWQPQLGVLADGHRVLRVDHRGHGESPLPPAGATVELFARDVLALLDQLGVERAALCGLSLGGAVCLQLAATAPERVDRVVVGCTSARFGEPGPWAERARVVRADGVGAVADRVVARWFTPGFAERQRGLVARYAAMLRSTPPEGYARCCEAVGRWDGRDRLMAIQAPTTVIAGRHDLAAPPAWGEAIAAGIRGARFELLDAAHLANVEQPEAFAALVLETLDGLKDAA
jgi:3-oxoadipate enol-lactonase